MLAFSQHLHLEANLVYANLITLTIKSSLIHNRGAENKVYKCVFCWLFFRLEQPSERTDQMAVLGK